MRLILFALALRLPPLLSRRPPVRAGQVVLASGIEVASAAGHRMRPARRRRHAKWGR